MEQRQLNFAEKSVQVLTLEELEKSYHENLTTGEPVGGIYHFALIQEVLEMFEKRGLKPVVQEIFAANNKDSKRPGVTVLPQLEAEFGEKAIEAHLLRRVYANIEIRADETDDVVTCLAVAYHQKDIQLGIGPMVKVCHNQTILGAQDVVSNFTCFSGQSRKDKFTLDMVLARAQQWAEVYEQNQEARRESVGRMKSALMDREAMLRLIGVLVEKRILHDTSNKLIHDGAPYPLNSGQINETAEQLIALFSGYRTQGTGTQCSAGFAQMSQIPADAPTRSLSPCAPDAISYWDAYQRLNTVLKPDRMDIPQVLPQSLALFETLKEMIK